MVVLCLTQKHKNIDFAGITGNLPELQKRLLSEQP